MNVSSSYDVENYYWKDTNDVATYIAEWMTAITNKDHVNIECNYSTHWLELHYLPYFDLVCFTIINVIYNLLLSTLKRMFYNWIDNGDLTREDLHLMKRNVEGLVLLVDFDVISLDRITTSLLELKAAE